MLIDGLSALRAALAASTAFQDWVLPSGSGSGETPGDRAGEAAANVILFGAETQDTPARCCVVYQGDGWERTQEAMGYWVGSNEIILQFAEILTDDPETQTALLSIGQAVDGIMGDLEQQNGFLIQSWRIDSEDPCRAERGSEPDFVMMRVLIEGVKC